MRISAMITLIGILTSLTAFGQDRLNISTDVQCHAEQLRQQYGMRYLVNGVLNLRLNVKEDDSVALNYVGHVGIGALDETNDNDVNENLFYYGVFSGNDKANTLSPRATTYPDSEYFRFRSFNANFAAFSEGSGMWGYLVVSKKYFTSNRLEPFDAHYVMQSGDHMGGTVDFVCRRR